MADKFSPPPYPPPNYRASSQSTLPRPQETHPHPHPQRVSWQPGGPSREQLGSNNPFREGSLTPHGGRPTHGGGPSSGSGSMHNSPHGMSSRHPSDVDMSDDEFLPPKGPPPGREMAYQPPPGSPPRTTSPPPYDPWLGPDDSLRPPPAFNIAGSSNDRSPTANADFDDAARAHAWCRENPLWPAQEHDDHMMGRIEVGDVRLTVPPNTTDVTQYQPELGRSYIRTTSAIGDTVLLSDIPIYASFRQSPLVNGQPRTIYFEVKVMSLGDRYNPANQIESGIAIGMLAPPYPSWRLPGWHRGSLGVHSDDGRRYVDNSFGGKEFTAAFRKGDVVGIGMTFAPPVHGDRVPMRCECFFTRNGRKDGAWDLHEERDADADEGDVAGLEGHYDLLAAVGVFGSVELECIFRRDDWMFKP